MPAKKLAATATIVAICSMCLGCDALLGLLTAGTVTVELDNQSPDYSVEVTLYYHDDEDVFEEVLVTPLTTKREELIAAGTTTTFSARCDDLRAIIIEDAELQDLLVRPNDSSDVLRINEDFICGQTIVFTFTHSALVADFRVTSSVR